ncbi:MAG: hypothetical protein LBU70_05790 [Chitinispirillales bacterium]|jgi:hypothetical protein|nr:hypothetical protein [Chitinispirillales bacterium]
MSKFKKLSKLAHFGLAVIAVTTIAAWAQELQFIEIRSFEDLQKIGKDPAYPLWGAYMLMADITMEPGWEPIGKWSVDSIEVAELCHPIGGCPNPVDVLFADPFRGSFHGNGRTIKGLSVNINKSEQACAPCS